MQDSVGTNMCVFRVIAHLENVLCTFEKKTNFSNIPSASHDKHISEKIDHSPTLTLTPIIEN